jgi:hypothetical protein
MKSIDRRWLLASACCCLALAAATDCRADGGAVRAIRTSGPFQIAAFTAPNPLTAGTVDISALVQDAVTMEPVPEVEITITVKPRGGQAAALQQQATADAATNKLFRACLVELEAGEYDAVVMCRSSRGRGQVEFAFAVGPRPPRLSTLWPWIGWPVVPIALFSAHQWMANRRRRRGSETPLRSSIMQTSQGRAGLERRNRG